MLRIHGNKFSLGKLSQTSQLGIAGIISSCAVVLVLGLMPVSYTHLDVYKRQVFFCVANAVIGIAVFKGTHIVGIYTNG